ncbi:MAG: 50S ribosomal protein L18 [Candidatus Omnitrophica bacterium]|nr:50S ribosomal protein L18 [Candidatus Omnitrophota bacterium]
MDKNKLKEIKRKRRHLRVKKKIYGTGERPRLYVHRSHKNMYAQIIDDTKGRVLFSLSTLNKEIRERIVFGGNIKSAEILGEILAQKLKERSIDKVVFDRGSYPYTGRIKAFAEGARKGGLIF